MNRMRPEKFTELQIDLLRRALDSPKRRCLISRRQHSAAYALQYRMLGTTYPNVGDGMFYELRPEDEERARAVIVNGAADSASGTKRHD